MGSYLPNKTPLAGSAPAVREGLTAERTIVGTSDVLKYVMYRVEQVAATSATVLLLGETGTGKELVARAIHNESPRRHKKFVVVNCGALPPTLIESELFGRERGAFTGAHCSQAGRFELADGGTIFLDEIGELPLELQPKLLRVLQEGQLERLGGGARTVHTDVRVIAATNRNLVDDVRHGKFRQDLFYRLNVFPITLPALRDRRDDLPALLHHFCDRVGRQLGKKVERIAPGSLQALEQYEWPGNIREFENVIQQGVILSRDGILDLSGFRGQPIHRESLPACEDLLTLVDVQRAHIRRILDTTGWRIEGPSGAARLLGLCPSTLRTRMRKLGINRPATAGILGGSVTFPPQRTWSRPAESGLGAAAS